MDCEVPDTEYAPLAFRLESRADRATEFGSVCGEVVGEQRDGEQLEHQRNDGGAQPHDVVGQPCQLLTEAVVAEELISQTVEVDAVIQIVLEPEFGIVDQPWCTVDEVDRLLGEHAAHNPSEDREQRDGDPKHQERADAPSDPAMFEPVHRRFERKGEEEGDQQRHEEAREVFEQLQKQPERRNSSEEQNQGPRHPSRHLIGSPDGFAKGRIVGSHGQKH